MNRIFLIIAFYLSYNLSLEAQYLSAEIGGHYFQSKLLNPADAKYSSPGVQENAFVRIRYDQEFGKRWMFGIGATAILPTVTWDISEYPFSNLISSGARALNMGTFDIRSTYFVFSKDKIRIGPSLALMPGFAEGMFFGGTVIESGFGIANTAKKEAYPGFTFLLESALNVEIILWKKLLLRFQGGYLQGTRVLQEMDVTYTLLKEGETFIANTTNDGSAVFLSFGVGLLLKKEFNFKRKREKN